MHNKLKRRFTWTAGILAGLIIMFSILVILLPTIITWYATSWLEEQGVNASIEDISIELSNGQVRVKTFKAVGPEKHKIELGEFFVQVHLRDLLDNKITIEKIQFADFYIDVYQQLGKPTKIGGIVIGDPDAAKTEISEQQNEPTAWEFVLKDIGFSNIKTCVNSHNQQGKPLYNDCLELGDLTWDGQFSYLLDTKANGKSGKLVTNLSFALNNLRLHDTTDNKEVINIGSLHINDLAVDGLNNIKIKSVKFDDYKVLQRAKEDVERHTHVANVEHITLTKLNINNLN